MKMSQPDAIDASSPPAKPDCRKTTVRSTPTRLRLVFFGVLATLWFGVTTAHAYDHEVFWRNGYYRWKNFGVEQGQTSDLATAINNAIGSGSRELHILVGGKLHSQVNLQGGLTLQCHDNTFEKTHGSPGFHREGSGGIAIYNMTLWGGSGYGIRISRASDLTFGNLTIYDGGIGIRVDSHPSRPYEDGRWVSNLNVFNCHFENNGGHGLETYGVEGFEIDDIVARNCGECGVLVNKGRNGHVGFVDAYRCSYGGGYAGLRFANNCDDITVDELIAVECGRGFFTVSDCEDITVANAYIRDCSSHAILLQHSNRVGINAGTFNGTGLNHYTSTNCWINAVPIGQRSIINRASGRCLEVSGAQNSDGANVVIWDYLGGTNQKWSIADIGSGNFSIRSSMSGGRGLDSGWSPQNGTSVYIWDFWSGDPQKWKVQSVGDSHFRINPLLNSSQCLDAYGSANGSDAGLWSYWGGSNQQWSIQNP